MQNSLLAKIHASDISESTKEDVILSAILSIGSPLSNAKEDYLKKIFQIQAGLNNLIFEKHNLKDKNGELMNSDKMRNEGRAENIGVNSITAEWLYKFTTALKDELRELEEELPWKWWSKDNLDMQNIRVEIVDILFFTVCLSIAAGLDASDLEELYRKKAVVNLERQFKDYSKATKSESDNLSIKV